MNRRSETLEFRKSSLSEGNGACVEVSRSDATFVVRNSRDKEGPTITFTRDEWKAFVGGVKLGEFDA